MLAGLQQHRPPSLLWPRRGHQCSEMRSTEAEPGRTCSRLRPSTPWWATPVPRALSYHPEAAALGKSPPRDPRAGPLLLMTLGRESPFTEGPWGSCVNSHVAHQGQSCQPRLLVGSQFFAGAPGPVPWTQGVGGRGPSQCSSPAAAGWGQGRTGGPIAETRART